MKKTVLITGASSGIGREFAYLYAKDGDDLIVVARSKKGLESLKKEIESSKQSKVTIIVLDLAQEGAAKELYKRVGAGKVDVLINNAGVGDFGQTVDMDPARVASMIRLNITSLTELSILFGKEMKSRRSGAILNVGSIASFQPLPYFNPYSASKAYVLSFSESLAKELEEFGVTVTCLCPGTTKTGFFDAAGVPEVNQEKGIMSAREVAVIGKRALEKKKLTVVPGFRNWARSFMTRFLPRTLVAKVAKRYMVEFK